MLSEISSIIQEQLESYQQFRQVHQQRFQSFQPGQKYIADLVKYVIKVSNGEKLGQSINSGFGSCRITMYAIMACFQKTKGKLKYFKDCNFLLPTSQTFLDKLQQSSIFGFRLKKLNSIEDHCVVFMKGKNVFCLLNSFQQSFSLQKWFEFYKGQTAIKNPVMVKWDQTKQDFVQVPMSRIMEWKPWRNPMAYAASFIQNIRNSQGESFPTFIQEESIMIDGKNKVTGKAFTLDFLEYKIVREYFHD